MNIIKSATVAILALGLLAGVTACSQENDSYARICENSATHQRVADKQCQATARPSYIWIYIAATQKAPAVGEKITTGTRTLPKGTSVEEAPVHGGVIEEPHVNVPVEHAPVVVEPHVVVVP